MLNNLNLCCLLFLAVVASCMKPILGDIDLSELLASMTVEEKIGQMVQIDINKFVNGTTGLVDYSMLGDWINTYHIGALLSSPFILGKINDDYIWNVTQWRDVLRNVYELSQKSRLKIPLLYGIDSMHGAVFLQNATLFPQSIAIAASFDLTHARNSGKTSSKDTRACGIPWLSAPVLGLGLNPLWSRFPETFGEDMHLAAEMGAAMIKGIQDVANDNGVPRRAAASMKHFIGYSDPQDGHDRSPVQLSDRSLRQLYLPAFRAAIEAGVMTSVQGYNEVGGVPMVSSSQYLKTLLRSELNFTGMLVTDYEEIENLQTWHYVAATQREAVKLAMRDSSIDLSMVAYDTSFNELLLSLYQSGEVPEWRIDESVMRLLTLKKELGLFDNPIISEDANSGTVGQESDWQLALAAARGSITLLKNENGTLPVRKESSVFVTGPTCDSLTSQSGGWTFHWQGALSDSEFGKGATILQGIREVFMGEVSYLPGPSLSEMDLSAVDLAAVREAVRRSDHTVVCIGEKAYAEKKGDIDDLALPSGQIQYVSAIRAAIAATNDASKRLTVVIVSGRPRILGSIPGDADAILNSYLPGPMGGAAVAEILAGVTVPSGRLPYSYPKHSGDVPYAYHHKVGDQCGGPDGYRNCDVEWAFGHGLSYTAFHYSGLSLSDTLVDQHKNIEVSVTVRNSGEEYAADHSVLLFVVDFHRRVTPEYKLLKRFEKVSLSPHESTTLSWTLSAHDWEFVGMDSRYVLEAGRYAVAVGGDVDCRSEDERDWVSANGGEVMCAGFNLSLTADYHPVCDYACALWEGGLCGERLGGSNCRERCLAQGWAWNYVDCLQQYTPAMHPSCSSVEQMQCFSTFAAISSGNTYNTSISISISSRSSSENNGNIKYSPELVLISLICGIVGSGMVGAAGAYLFLRGRLGKKHHDLLPAMDHSHG